MAPDVSVVAAVHNDSSSLEELCVRIRQSFGGDCHIVLVDDCSADDSYALMRRLDVEAIRLPLPAGQNGALLEGLRRARGRVCCVLDADLEDPPEALPQLTAALDDGVTRVAFSMREGPRRFSSRVFRRFLQLVYPALPSRACLCFAADRGAVEAIVRTARTGDYLVAVIGALALPATQVPVARERRHGRPTGYPGILRLRHGSRMAWSALRVRSRVHSRC